MSLVEHAESELRRAGLFDRDSDYGGMLGDACLAIVKVFAAQRHSGLSAEMTTKIVSKLMRYQPLTPLTSEPSEWLDRSRESGEPMWQSRRNPSVLSKDGGTTWYDLDEVSE